MHPSIVFRRKVSKSIDLGRFCGYFLICFGNHFPSKIDERIDAKIDAEKVVNIMKNRCENGAEIDRIFDNFRKLASRKNEFSE